MPEATNAPVTHSTLLPAFSFGIPGIPTSAVILGAMMPSGLTPGPMRFAEHAEIPYAVFARLFLATVFLWLIGLVATTMWVGILMVPPALLAIGVILFVVIASYVARTNLFDPQLAVVAGVLGCIMKKAHFSAPALVVGFILGPIIKTNARRAVAHQRDRGDVDALTSVLLMLSVAALAFGVREHRDR